MTRNLSRPSQSYKHQDAVAKTSSMLRVLAIATISLLASLFWDALALADDPSPAAVDAALRHGANGRSTDEVIADPRLREAVLAHLSTGADGTAIDERESLLAMLKYRKAGKLAYRTTDRTRHPSSNPTTITIAEMAARAVMDRHRVTTDTMFCDPSLRAEFLQQAASLSGPDTINEAELIRAAMSLRKRRQLRPELVLTVANWGRQMETLSLDEARRRSAKGNLPERPGIYVFRDATGYLYIGEAKSLAERLAEHLGGSDRVSLAEYLQRDRDTPVTIELHVFDAESPAAKTRMRRAYESELIRSRQPQFNVRP